MTKIAIFLISIYQKYLSPYKGYRCAYGVAYGGNSCSQKVKEIIENKGVFQGWSDIQTQFIKCKIAYISITKDKKDKKSKSSIWDSCTCNPCPGMDNCDIPNIPCDCSL